MADPVDNLASEVSDSLKLNGDSNMNKDAQASNGNCEQGFPEEELYRLALRFYKDKEGKAMHLSYADKLKFVALTKQVAHGKCRPEAKKDVGFLDVVGNDRRQAWQALGDMSKEEAMEEFVERLDRVCPLFKPYLEAHKAEKEEMERKKREEEEKREEEAREEERKRLEQEALEQQEKERQKQLQQELHIRSALNQQTAVQFQQYAQQQFPNNPQQQEVLINQLQEQHFQQYMQQVYQQQLLHQQQQFQQIATMNGQAPPAPHHPQQADGAVGSEMGSQRVVEGTAVEGTSSQHPNQPPQPPADTDDDHEGKGSGDAPDAGPIIAAPSMWTRKDIAAFKDSLRKDPDSLIKVGSGETVTVRVPTHEDGTCLFWEFATDSYDIGFGVFFEWTIAPNNQVSVHVSESSDDEELDEDGEEGGGGGGAGSKDDVEKGSMLPKKGESGPPTDEIIPVYRRDCHEEVYCGSHMYPGQGVYLLKFDNSYSLWRSKTLYYRVYYTR